MTTTVPVEDLVQRGLARPQDPLRGPVPTLWSSDGPEDAWVEAEEILVRARPPVVQVHSWVPGRVDELVRQAIPGVQIIVGFGIDSIARSVALGQRSVAWGVRQFLMLAQRAHDVGALGVVWNAEASWKRPPTSPEAARLRELITTALAAVREAYPALRQFHTSYDHPSYHSTYPWPAWLGRGSPIEESFFQVYAGAGKTALAHRGALPAREARALASFGAAVRAGWIVPDDPATELREGIRWGAYYQLHHVQTSDTVACAVDLPRVCLWAVRSRSDEAGRAALLALCELWRRGYWGADGVRRFQAASGLVADGVCGVKTLASLGIAP